MAPRVSRGTDIPDDGLCVPMPSRLRFSWREVVGILGFLVLLGMGYGQVRTRLDTVWASQTDHVSMVEYNAHCENQSKALQGIADGLTVLAENQQVLNDCQLEVMSKLGISTEGRRGALKPLPRTPTAMSPMGIAQKQQPPSAGRME